MEQPLGCYFQVWSPYYQVAVCNQSVIEKSYCQTETKMPLIPEIESMEKIRTGEMQTDAIQVTPTTAKKQTRKQIDYQSNGECIVWQRKIFTNTPKTIVKVQSSERNQVDKKQTRKQTDYQSNEQCIAWQHKNFTNIPKTC